ncbi:hypothetical protein KM043_015756, partial [Ampulex compressa]
TVSKTGKVSARLICSKSKVAPLSRVTIPRLELCAALVLMKLFVKVKAQFEVPIKRVVFLSDSTIVLCWLHKVPHLLRTFESNRVAEIQKLGDLQWTNVRSEDNPADALSRGQHLMDFVNNTLWSSGPAWLAQRNLASEVRTFISEFSRLKKGFLPAHLLRGFVHLFSFHFVPALCQGGGSDAPVETADGP